MHDFVEQCLDSGCMGLDCFLAGTKDNLKALPCYSYWPLLGKPLGMLGVGRNDQLMGLDLLDDILEEPGMLIPEVPGMFAAEGCTLDRCRRA